MYGILLILAYFTAAALAITANTHVYRIAAVPVIALLAWLSATSIDMSIEDLMQRYNNAVYITLVLVFIVARAVEWSIPTEPFVRDFVPGKGSRSAMKDVFSLALAFRGQGWNWARSVYVPRETRPMDRKGFLFSAFVSAVIHAFLTGVFHVIFMSFLPNGGSIFDATLPFYTRYLRACIISVPGLLCLYAFVQAAYDVFSIVAIAVLRHDPEDWPPVFDAPWCATSVTEFWGRRWHQWFRHYFFLTGGYPLSLVFGKPGFVVGMFLSSATLHYCSMGLLNDQVKPTGLFVGLIMAAPIVLAEIAYKRWTGRKVEGVTGWIWTWFWMAVCGCQIMDGYAVSRVFECYNYTQIVVPRKDVLEGLVVGFDAWLHGM